MLNSELFKLHLIVTFTQITNNENGFKTSVAAL